MRIHTLPNGKQVHLGGRKRPSVTSTSHPHLFKSVRRYMSAPLPVAPNSFDYTTAAATACADILGNSTLGDCTAAGAGHIIDAMTANAGAPVVIQTADAIKFYSLTTGYDGTPATDLGGDEVTVCTYWQQHGYDGAGCNAIAGYLEIDEADEALVKSCCWLFGSLYFGLELATPWTQIGGSGFTWDVGSPPNPEDGHCVAGIGANPNGILVDTWGLTGTITWAAIKQFCAESAGGNLFAILTQDAINSASAKAPSGFDFAALVADFNQLGGSVLSTPAPATGLVAT